MRLVANQQVDAAGGLLHGLRVRPQGLVAGHQDAVPPLVGQSPVFEFLLAVGTLPALHQQRFEPRVVEPLLDLPAPVSHERRGARDDSLPHHRLPRDRALLQERPQQRDHLQRLAHAHLVREETSLVGRTRSAPAAQTDHALVHEPDPISLVRPEVPADERVHHDGEVGPALGQVDACGGQHDRPLLARIVQGLFLERQFLESAYGADGGSKRSGVPDGGWRAEGGGWRGRGSPRERGSRQERFLRYRILDLNLPVTDLHGRPFDARARLALGDDLAGHIQERGRRVLVNRYAVHPGLAAPVLRTLALGVETRKVELVGRGHHRLRGRNRVRALDGGQPNLRPRLAYERCHMSGHQ